MPSGSWKQREVSSNTISMYVSLDQTVKEGKMSVVRSVFIKIPSTMHITILTWFLLILSKHNTYNIC